ncbi:MAG: hypothetical protein AAGH64_02210, partial [Planctomycetota bacterium]
MRTLKSASSEVSVIVRSAPKSPSIRRFRIDGASTDARCVRNGLNPSARSSAHHFSRPRKSRYATTGNRFLRKLLAVYNI